MFTGLVKEAARVVSMEQTSEKLWKFKVLSLTPEACSWRLGASIAFNGVCLTLVATESEPNKEGQILSFEISPETMERSALGSLENGGLVHLEPSLRVGDELGGHWVLGHVDACGLVKNVRTVDQCLDISISVSGEAQKKVAPYLVEKGSIAVDGVSLTINFVEDSDMETVFSVMLVPHTLKVTHFSNLKNQQKVNLEADILGKFSARNEDFKSMRLDR